MFEENYMVGQISKKFGVNEIDLFSHFKMMNYFYKKDARKFEVGSEEKKQVSSDSGQQANITIYCGQTELSYMIFVNNSFVKAGAVTNVKDTRIIDSIISDFINKFHGTKLVIGNVIFDGKNARMYYDAFKSRMNGSLKNHLYFAHDFYQAQ
ncbi:MAG: hypothetical protein K6G88_15445 [Lachnospiraceae bacterium]|nr:hypothetical protein [Lachnospiraceae bacterium]